MHLLHKAYVYLASCEVGYHVGSVHVSHGLSRCQAASTCQCHEQMKVFLMQGALSAVLKEHQESYIRKGIIKDERKTGMSTRYMR